MESNQTTERKTYHEQKYIDNTLRLREILKTLPPFAKDYFRAIEPRSSARTRIMPLFVAGVFYFIFNGVVAFAMERIEKKLSYYH